MQITSRHIIGIVPLIALMVLAPAGNGPAYADCRWVKLGVDSYWICDEDGAPARSSVTETSTVTRRIVPSEPATGMEPRDAAMRVAQADAREGRNQREPRKRIKRSKPRRSERNRRPPLQQTQWISQRFGTSVMGARVRGTVERRGDDLRGVVYVSPPFGKKNTYHFTGKIQGNRVFASHHSGHSFQGEIVGGRRIVGVVTSRRGTRIPLDVPLGGP